VPEGSFLKPKDKDTPFPKFCNISELRHFFLTNWVRVIILRAKQKNKNCLILLMDLVKKQGDLVGFRQENYTKG
jgi:hypothetical protein